MKFEYTGRHVEVTPAIRQHVEDQFGKIDHVFDGSSTLRTHIIITVEKNRHIGEVLVHWREHTLTATDTNADMYQALTRAITKIEKQALKLKKKIIGRSHHATPLSALTPADVPPDGDDAAAAPATTRGRIINARRYNVKPMTAEEARLHLSDEPEQFLVFRDADMNNRVSVLYKRKDGNYGLIQP